MGDKTYRGRRLEPSRFTASATVVTVEDNHTREVVPLEHHVLHSPSGFAWGYGGSGPAELARCILWDHLGHEPHPAEYQPFKEAFVARLEDEWSLSSAEIDGWLAAHRPEVLRG